MKTKKVAIITPGGDASGMNACIRAIVRKGISSGYEMFCIYHGYEGLLNNEIQKLSSRSVGGIIHLGGTILKSSRCKKIQEENYISIAAQILKKNNIDYLVVIGGDGSLKAAHRLSGKGIKVIGIPASIDNDIPLTEETIGFDTAIDTAVEAIDKIRDTAMSFERIFIIEVMGREHGFLALTVGIASGAEFVLIPEVKYNLNNLYKEIKKMEKIGKKTIFIIFAEGCGNPYTLANSIQKNTGLEVKVSSLGYIQRGGSPSTRSRILACEFGVYAIELINQNKKNRVIVLQKNKVTDVFLGDVIKKEKTIDIKTYRLIKELAI